MILTETSKQPASHSLRFYSGPGYPGIVAVSFDYMRTYLISNSGCGRSDEYHLRINGTWMPYQGTVEDMIRLAQQVESQNEYAEQE